MTGCAAEAVSAARAIEGWLLDSGVQLPDGPHRGGVAGWLDRHHRPEFVYPEITGYYLVYTAWLAGGGAGSRRRAADAQAHGRMAVRWLRRAIGEGAAPPTRVYLDSRRQDWRNAATFSFDLAMAARGAASFATVAGDPDAAMVGRQLTERLRQLAGDVAPLRSHVLLDGSTASVPRRWSTLPGPHHVKAAAAVLRLPRGTADDALCRVCERTVAYWPPVLRSSWRWADLHPVLYCLEGELLMDGRDSAPREQLAGGYKRLIAHQRADGSVPGSLRADEATMRADVLAQALRTGALLRRQGLEGEVSQRRLDGLATALLSHVRRDGSVAFHRGDGRGNAWAGMFAHQALCLYACGDRGSVSDVTAALLV
jgi:hypothetical protein